METQEDAIRESLLKNENWDRRNTLDSDELAQDLPVHVGSFSPIKSSY